MVLAVQASLGAAHGFTCPTACGIFVPRSGIEPVFLGRWLLNHWTARDVTRGVIF